MTNNWNPRVENALKILLDSEGDGKTAVFDADGTLWPDDLGEAFFKHQVLHDLAPGAVGMKNPWEQYIALDKVSVADANAWITKLNTGVKLGDLRKQAKDFYDANFKQKFNPLMKELIGSLKSKGFKIWICTASMRWAIEPALYDIDIPLEHLVGLENEVDAKGLLTNVIKTPLPYGQGKKDALAQKLASPPQLVLGNSIGDLAMLGWATDLPIVIHYDPPKPEIVGSERALRHEAEVRGWLVQGFKA